MQLTPSVLAGRRRWQNKRRRRRERMRSRTQRRCSSDASRQRAQLVRPHSTLRCGVVYIAWRVDAAQAACRCVAMWVLIARVREMHKATRSNCQAPGAAGADGRCGSPHHLPALDGAHCVAFRDAQLTPLMHVCISACSEASQSSWGQFLEGRRARTTMTRSRSSTSTSLKRTAARGSFSQMKCG